MRNSLYNLLTVFLVNIMHVSLANAATWKAIEITPSLETYYDAESLSGPSNKKQITIGQNIIEVAQDGVRSRMMTYEIDCGQRTSLFKSMVNYNALNLGGVGTPVTIPANPPWPIKPKSLAERFHNVACSNNTTEQLGKTNPSPQEKNEAITPNLSVVTGFPKFPNSPNASAYQIMQIVGSSASTQRISLQIFSDGQAPFIRNGASTFLMHTGNGIFVDQDNKIILDEKNSQLSINGLIVKGVQFVKSPPPPSPSNQAYGEKINFFGKLSKATDETDLMAGCSAAAILGSSREWANKTTLEEARFFGVCMSMSMASDRNYSLKFSDWKEKLKNEDTFSLFKYTERCAKDFNVSFILKENSLGKYSKECAGVTRNR
jgi:hypothetical protein